MAEEKRGRGRPRKDEYDEDGNLLPPEVVEQKRAEEAVSNSDSAGAANIDMASLVEQLREEITKQVKEELTPPSRRVSGKWDYDYKQQPHLRVHGGLEVEHPEGFLPTPPSGIPMYVAVGGGTTDTVEAAVRKVLKHDENGDPKLDEKGLPTYTEYPITQAALKDENGDPVLTDEYKAWLHVKARGDRFNSNVMSDIRLGKGLPDGAVAEDVVFDDQTGIPQTGPE